MAWNVSLYDSSNNLVAGNLIGTDITGESQLTSTGLQNGTGVNLVDGSSDNTIGGTTAGTAPVISSRGTPIPASLSVF